MADIRIKDLAVTAGSSASDDYLAVDGATNGTRKLSAYSPTFGGNLTVSGVQNVIGSASPSANFPLRINQGATDATVTMDIANVSSGTSAAANIQLQSDAGTSFLRQHSAAHSVWPNYLLLGGSDKIAISTGSTSDGIELMTGFTTRVNITTATTTISNNLTVSGTGTSSVAGDLNVGSSSGNTFTGWFKGGGGTNFVAIGNISGGSQGIPSVNAYTSGFAGTTALGLNPNGGNVLIGTTTDGGQKLQVNGTAAISGGIVGTTTNDSAAAGIVGQYVSASVAYGARAANADGVIRNVTSISLTAGDWDVDGFVAFEGAGTTATIVAAGVSASFATLDDPEFGQTRISVSGVTGNVGVQTTGTRRVSIASTTTVYLTSRAFFSAGTVDTYGIIRARRVR